MSNKIKFSIEQRQEIIRRYRENLEWANTIAPDFNCSAWTLINALKEWGVPIRLRAPRVNLTDAQLERLAELYAEEKSLNDIAATLAVGREVITKALRKQGCIIRRRGKVQKYWSKAGESKQCGGCKKIKPTSDFSLHSTTYDGLQPCCRACNADSGRTNRLKQKFGLTLEQYNEMLERQSGLCAICGEPETRRKFGELTRLAVDHCHATGKVRELLCHRCNAAIGQLDDDPAKAAAAEAYLRRHKAA